MSNQTPLNKSPFHLIYSTKRNQFLRDLEGTGKWTDFIRMSFDFGYGSYSTDPEEQSSKLLKDFSEKFPDEGVEVRTFQLQYVEIN